MNTVVGFLVREIKSLALKLNFYWFNYVSGKSNVLGHKIAKNDSPCDDDFVWLENFLEFATDLASEETLNFLQYE